VSGNVVVQSASGGGQEQEWDVASAGNGNFTLVQLREWLGIGDDRWSGQASWVHRSRTAK
jgi:hypothetical protein